MSNENERAPALPHPALSLGYRPKKKFKDLEKRLENAMQIMAEIIADDGEDYLPIFESLERDLEKERAKNAALGRALTLAKTRRIES